jgi:tetratricopeptide (TPR) repeat protein
MISDISTRLGFDESNAALCGFSGGSKVAINAIGADAAISRLIYAGAVTQLSASHPIHILGFAGVRDMNYTDLLAFDESIRSSSPGAALVEFDGKHEWPDAGTFEKAFYWLAFDIWRQDPSRADTTLIPAFIRQSDRAISDAQRKNDWLAAYQECRTAYTFLDGLTDASGYKTRMESVAADPLYQKALAQKRQTLEKEANEKQVLLQAFQSQGGDWWVKVISGYQSSTSPSDKRLLGFISLASFSYSNQLLQQHNLDGAERILAIYELSDPANTDQLYCHAVLYAEKNNIPLAIKYLQKAVKNGFTDLQKMESEQAFQPLRSDPNFAPIEAALRKASK